MLCLDRVPALLALMAGVGQACLCTSTPPEDMLKLLGSCCSNVLSSCAHRTPEVCSALITHPARCHPTLHMQTCTHPVSLPCNACRMMQPQDEVFEDLDFDLLGDLPQAPTDGAAGDNKSRDQTSSQQHRQAASGDTTQGGTAPSAGAAGAAGGGPASTGGVPHEFDDEMFVMMDDHTQELPLAAEGQQQEEPSQSDHQQERDQPEAGGSHLQAGALGRLKGSQSSVKEEPVAAASMASIAACRSQGYGNSVPTLLNLLAACVWCPAGADQGVRRAKQQRKRKGGTLIMDDLDNLLIRWGPGGSSSTAGLAGLEEGWLALHVILTLQPAGMVCVCTACSGLVPGACCTPAVVVSCATMWCCALYCLQEQGVPGVVHRLIPPAEQQRHQPSAAGAQQRGITGPLWRYASTCRLACCIIIHCLLPALIHTGRRTHWASRLLLETLSLPLSGLLCRRRLCCCTLCWLRRRCCWRRWRATVLRAGGTLQGPTGCCCC